MTHLKKLKIAARESPLSILQVKEVMGMLPQVSFENLSVKSYGDKHQEISLMENRKEDLFTEELDTLVLEGKADLAIHSAKDLPWPLRQGLQVIALTAGKSNTDSLVSRGKQKLGELPVGSRIGTSSAERLRQLKEKRPDLIPVDIRGTIQERLKRVDEGKVEGLIIATCALERLGLVDLISEILPFTPHPLQGRLAVVSKMDRPELKALFFPLDARRTFGKVWLAGFGPGSPDLLTLKADKVLSGGDWIFYDDLIETSILERYPGIKEYVGKRQGKHSFTQEEINRKLYEKALEGKRVVRLKGGDPFIFGRGGEEREYLERRMIPVETIPGISAAQGASAMLGIPLTHRGESNVLSYHTSHSADEEESEKETLAWYMGATRLDWLSDKLLKKGVLPQTQVALIRNATLYNESCILTDVVHMADFNPGSPLMILVGRSAGKGVIKKKILYTGIETGLFRFDEPIFHYPLIETSPIEILDWNPSNYEGILFTSKNSVRYFPQIERAKALKIFAIGTSTRRELKKNGLSADYVPDTPDSEALSVLVEASGLKSILYPCSDLSSNRLHELGNVRPFVCYATLKKRQPPLDLSFFSGILFSSPSTVDSFFDIYDSIPGHVVCYHYGIKTKQKLIEKGARTEILIQIEPE